jgi:hypothetical protein
MNSFQVIIDYNYQLSSSNFIGKGKRGVVYAYVINGVDYIIKYDNDIYTITHRPVYSDSNKFTFDMSTNVNFIEIIKKYADMASVVNNLKHFIKIKGLVIFPNLTYTSLLKTKIFYSVIYEYAGELTNEQFLLNKENAIQLLEIFESFKQFNLAGYFHDDIQGCNNIEYNEVNQQLYVLDYDVRKYEDESIIMLERILVNIYKYITCIIRYQSNNRIKVDTTIEINIAIDIMREYLKNKSTVLDKTGKELKIKKINGFYYQEDESNENIKNITDLLKTYNGRLFNNIVEGAILYDINKIFSESIDKLKSIKSISVDYAKFSTLLENYIDNYFLIINLLNDIIDNKKITSEEAKICNDIIEDIRNITEKSILLFINTTAIYFKDANYIINSIYDKYIRQFNSSVVSKFKDSSNDDYYQKYLKYKNKYLQLKNNN